MTQGLPDRTAPLLLQLRMVCHSELGVQLSSWAGKSRTGPGTGGWEPFRENGLGWKIKTESIEKCLWQSWFMWQIVFSLWLSERFC